MVGFERWIYIRRVIVLRSLRFVFQGLAPVMSNTSTSALHALTLNCWISVPFHESCTCSSSPRIWNSWAVRVVNHADSARPAAAIAEILLTLQLILQTNCDSMEELRNHTLKSQWVELFQWIIQYGGFISTTPSVLPTYSGFWTLDRAILLLSEKTSQNALCKISTIHSIYNAKCEKWETPYNKVLQCIFVYYI